MPAQGQCRTPIEEQYAAFFSFVSDYFRLLNPQQDEVSPLSDGGAHDIIGLAVVTAGVVKGMVVGPVTSSTIPGLPTGAIPFIPALIQGVPPGSALDATLGLLQLLGLVLGAQLLEDGAVAPLL